MKQSLGIMVASKPVSDAKKRSHQGFGFWLKAKKQDAKPSGSARYASAPEAVAASMKERIACPPLAKEAVEALLSGGGKEDAKKQDAKPPGLSRYDSAPDEGADYMEVAPPGAKDALEALSEKHGVKILETALTEEDATKQDAKPSGLARCASAPHEGADFMKVATPRAKDDGDWRLEGFMKNEAAYGEKMRETALTAATDFPQGPPLDDRISSVKTQWAYAGDEEEKYPPTPPDAGLDWDAGYPWSAGMPGMMQPFGTAGMPWPQGMPDMIGTMPPSLGSFPDRAMHAAMYHQTMYQQSMMAWTSNIMLMGQHPIPPNVPPYPAPTNFNGDQETGDVRGQVWELAKTSSGSRRVQDALENAKLDAEKVELAKEMEGHVRDAYRCPHANHVLQKCITSMTSETTTKFIIEELNDGAGSAVKVARHRFGCRLLQRLFEHSSPDQVNWIVEELLEDAVELSKDAYANFVLQHVLEHASDKHKTTLVDLLTVQVAAVAEESNGSAVLQKAMEWATPDAQVKLSHALIAQPGLLVKMACSRHGHLTAKKALEVAEKPQRTQALIALETHTDPVTNKLYKEELKSSRYGRVLHRCLGELQALGVTPTASTIAPSAPRSDGHHHGMSDHWPAPKAVAQQPQEESAKMAEKSTIATRRVSRVGGEEHRTDSSLSVKAIAGY